MSPGSLRTGAARRQAHCTGSAGILNSGAFTSVQTSTDVFAYGSFSIDGTSLIWTAIPEPTSAPAGLLLTAGLLRRHRRA